MLKSNRVTILLLKKCRPCSLKVSLNIVAVLHVKANSKEICEDTSFPSFLKKMLMPAFLLIFKANHLEKIAWLPHFSLWIPIALAKIFFFRVILTWRIKRLYLVATVLKVFMTKKAFTQHCTFQGCMPSL